MFSDWRWASIRNPIRGNVNWENWAAFHNYDIFQYNLIHLNGFSWAKQRKITRVFILIVHCSVRQNSGHEIKCFPLESGLSTINRTKNHVSNSGWFAFSEGKNSCFITEASQRWKFEHALLSIARHIYTQKLCRKQQQNEKFCCNFKVDWTAANWLQDGNWYDFRNCENPLTTKYPLWWIELNGWLDLGLVSIWHGMRWYFTCKLLGSTQQKPVKLLCVSAFVQRFVKIVSSHSMRLGLIRWEGCWSNMIHSYLWAVFSSDSFELYSKHSAVFLTQF